MKCTNLPSNVTDPLQSNITRIARSNDVFIQLNQCDFVEKCNLIKTAITQTSLLRIKTKFEIMNNIIPPNGFIFILSIKCTKWVSYNTEHKKNGMHQQINNFEFYNSFGCAICFSNMCGGRFSTN